MQATTLTEQIVIDDNAEYQSKECTRYPAYGDEYLNKSQWYNAAFEYRISLQFTPQSEEALYRLTFSLLRLCETEQRGCDEAEKRLKDLHHTNCKPEDLKELMLRWEGIKQRMPQSEISD